MGKVNWKDLDDDILAATRDLRAKGFKEPTVRAVYYVLGSLGKIPLTEQGYKALDAKVVRMRKEEKIEWGFFAVKRGRSIGAGQYFSPEGWANYWVERLKEADASYSLPRWYGQPRLVEVWVEKDGLLGAVANWLGDLDVTVRAPQGYGAWEFIHSNVEDIEARMRKMSHEEVHILYLGDLDPSGKDIPRFMNEDALSHFGLKADFSELALTVGQVRAYELPEVPDAPEVRAKIGRDPRLKAYRAVYGDMFCELDAFFALQTDAARKLIRDSVEALFDDGLDERRRHQEERGRREVGKIRDAKVKEMAKE